jgi:DNA-directed RNA polymerase subunit K/omega
MSHNTNYSNVSLTTITRDLREFDPKTENIYESVAVISKRANQIANEIKDELKIKLDAFVPPPLDSLEEIFEDPEQIAISKYYERLPKPTLIATQEFLDGKVYFSNPVKEEKIK